MHRINTKQLRKRCLDPISRFYSLGEKVDTVSGMYIYIDRGAPVLAVAHLDTVQDDNHFYHLQLGKERIVFNTQLDDRLGAHIILDYLPKFLGYDAFDILLTEGEEIGQSTGEFFKPSHDYNWMFQFDRAGTDVVMYQYDTKESRELLKDYKFKPANGSFSDISSMDDVGCVGFNFGCAYYDNHGSRSHCDLDQTEMMVGKFVKFFKDNKDTYMKAPENAPYRGRSWSHYYDGYGNYRGTDTYPSYTSIVSVGDCANCNRKNVGLDQDKLCTNCQDAGTVAGKYGTSDFYQPCVVCSVYAVLNDDGLCYNCEKHFEDPVKEDVNWCDNCSSGIIDDTGICDTCHQYYRQYDQKLENGV